MGADKMLVKPMHTRVLLQQIEKLLSSHEEKLKIWSAPAPKTAAAPSAALPASVGKKAPVKRAATTKDAAPATGNKGRPSKKAAKK
jgi:DNA-binding response OmpR family regulator